MQVLRIGKISSANYEKGTAKVTYEDRDGATSNEFPFLAWTYWVPKIGERVLVGYLSDGSTAVILGPIWYENRRPAEFGAELYRQEMANTPGQAYTSYSGESKTMTLKAGSIQFQTDAGSATIGSILSRLSALEARV